MYAIRATASLFGRCKAARGEISLQQLLKPLALRFVPAPTMWRRQQCLDLEAKRFGPALFLR